MLSDGGMDDLDNEAILKRGEAEAKPEDQAAQGSSSFKLLA